MTSVEEMTIEELRDEVASLRQVLDRFREERTAIALRRHFRMTPVEVGFLLGLYNAKGECVTHRILDGLSPAPSGLLRDSNVSAVYISRIRKALGKNSVDSVWGRGWAITPVGIAAVDRALEAEGVTL